MIGWIIFLAISISALVLIIKKKDHFEIEPMIKWEFSKSKIKFLRKLPDIPLIYTILQKSKFGITWCDRFVARHPKLVRRMKWPVVILGVTVMVLTFITIIWALQDQIIKELTKVEYLMSSVALVLPFKVDSKAVFYVPFIYWVIGVFVTVVVHEGGHAIVARYLKVPIESTGLAIMAILVPVIPAAYVKPDEEALKKENASDKIWMYAAGGVFNIIFGIFMFFVVTGVSLIGYFNGYPYLFPVELGPLWYIYLFNSTQIIFVFNIGIGMMNLFPMVPLDGGHMLRLIFEKLKWKAWAWKAASIGSCVLLLATFIVPAIVRKFVGG